jgi:hypothetical protein
MTVGFAPVPTSAGEIAMSPTVNYGVALVGFWALPLDRCTRMHGSEATTDMAAERAGHHALDVGVFALTGPVAGKHFQQVKDVFELFPAEDAD